MNRSSFLHECIVISLVFIVLTSMENICPVLPISATPLKGVKCCLTCNKSPRGHVRNLKNVAMKSIYSELFAVLDFDATLTTSQKLFICDPCILTVKKILEMRDTLKKNLAFFSQEERHKRVIFHSVSPDTKRLKDISNTCTIPTRKRTFRKQLFVSSPQEAKAVGETSEFLDHQYFSLHGKDLTVNEIFHAHHKKILQNIEIQDEAKMLLAKAWSLSMDQFLLELLKVDTVNDRIWQLFMFRMSSQLDLLCGKMKPSVLRTKITELSPGTFFKNILQEMHRECPRVLDFLITMCTPMHLQLPDDCHVVAAIYALAMYTRNPQLVAFQKAMCAACVRYSAGNGLLGLLHKLGMCIPEKSKLPLLDEVGHVNGIGVSEALRSGCTIKVTVDNIDGRIKAYQVRLGSGNRDFHYTHWSVVVDRVMPIDLSHLPVLPRVVTAEGPDPKLFFVSVEEQASLRKSYMWLIERILLEEIPAVSMFNIPPVMDHKYRDIVDRPSQVYPMFVIMKDPKSLPNCVQIMQTMQETLRSFYMSADRGEEFETTSTVPLGGDQLTRTTFDSARNLRAGTHTRSDRLEQFTPVVEEMFHVQQDLLEKIIKKYFTADSAREVGTLANYKAILHRTNVNGKVKSDGYEAHKDFLFTVVRGLVIELACETFGMTSKLDLPAQVPDEVRVRSKSERQEWLDNKVKPMVDLLCQPYTYPKNEEVRMLVVHRGVAYNVSVPAHQRGESILIHINGEPISINVPALREGPEEVTGDDLYTYSVSFFRVAMDLMLFHHTVKSGDIDTMTILLKRFIPLFIALSSYRSKYAIECINFLTKTECVLSEYESVRVKIGTLVNGKGKAGKNKPADMQQENNIKLVKHVIRGLGAGKTDKAMERSSKAAPVVSEVVEGLNASVGQRQKERHSKKSLANDMSSLAARLRTIQPFKVNKDRKLAVFHDLPPNILTTVNKYKLKEFIVRHSARAVSSFVLEQDDIELLE